MEALLRWNFTILICLSVGYKKEGFKTLVVQPGTRFGPYEIVAPLGAGGMGEVYRARDTRLDRDVALKILPGIYATDQSRLLRFQQEARAAGILNHPNIVCVYDVGSSDEHAPYLVGELLDGETLRAELNEGPFSERKALGVAVQIARGLAAAHARGIVHRDLKPDNVFLTRDGHVKILDFGLAKLTLPDRGDTQTPTIAPATDPGMVLGTVGYMSPEQVRGTTADHRADLFAFGAILYEMLAGARAFERDTSAESMTAILKESVSASPLTIRQISPALERIVYRCLEKDPTKRFQSADDLAFALEGLSSVSDLARRVEPSERRQAAPTARWAIAGVLLVVTAALAAAAATFLLREPNPEPPVVRATILPPSGVEPAQLAIGPLPGRLALSPDGQHLAFIASTPSEDTILWLRSLADNRARIIAGSEGASYPFWSPDGASLAFFTRAGQLKRVALAGGSPTTISAEARLKNVGPQGLAWGLGASWGLDNVIVFGRRNDDTPLQRVSASGGPITPATSLDTNNDEGEQAYPWFLPDGRHFLYLSISRQFSVRGIYVGSLDGSPPKKLIDGGSNAFYANGYLVFARDRTVYAQPFDVSRLEVSGAAVPLAEGLLDEAVGPFFPFTVSQTGTLAFESGTRIEGSQLEWRDRSGKLLGTLGARAEYRDLQISPDGRYVAVSMPNAKDGNADIWWFDLRRNLPSPFTSDAVVERGMVWSPDSTRTIFNARVSGKEQFLALYQRAASGGEKSLLLQEEGFNLWPESWSPDGKHLLYSRIRGGVAQGAELRVVPLTGTNTISQSLLGPSIRASRAEFSPDGRWIVYQSNEAGGNEVYVMPFPGPGRRVRVSTTGGTWPKWGRDGRELFYLSSRETRTLADNRLIATQVRWQGLEFDVGESRELMTALIPPTTMGNPFVAAPDGQRFLLNTPAQDQPDIALSLVVNWPATIKP